MASIGAVQTLQAAINFRWHNSNSSKV